MYVFCLLKFDFQSAGKSGESVAELKKKLAAAEAKTRDFGKNFGPDSPERFIIIDCS